MNKEERVIKYYLICNRLKEVIRTGWISWNLNKERIESIAEHIFGVQMLAIAMHKEYEYDLDLKKVIYMLAIHELGETLIGDLTQFEITKEDKEIKELDAVKYILKDLVNGKEIEDLFIEFEEKTTKEALFAYQCDKLECDIQCRIYDETTPPINLDNQKDNKAYHNKDIQELLKEDAKHKWSNMWIKFGQRKYPYDENFKKVSNYILNNEITKKG